MNFVDYLRSHEVEIVLSEAIPYGFDGWKVYAEPAMRTLYVEVSCSDPLAPPQGFYQVDRKDIPSTLLAKFDELLMVERTLLTLAEGSAVSRSSGGSFTPLFSVNSRTNTITLHRAFKPSAARLAV